MTKNDLIIAILADAKALAVFGDPEHSAFHFAEGLEWRVIFPYMWGSDILQVTAIYRRKSISEQFEFTGTIEVPDYEFAV